MPINKKILMGKDFNKKNIKSLMESFIEDLKDSDIDVKVNKKGLSYNLSIKDIDLKNDEGEETSEYMVSCNILVNEDANKINIRYKYNKQFEKKDEVKEFELADFSKIRLSLKNRGFFPSDAEHIEDVIKLIKQSYDIYYHASEPMENHTFINKQNEILISHNEDVNRWFKVTIEKAFDFTEAIQFYNWLKTKIEYTKKDGDTVKVDGSVYRTLFLELDKFFFPLVDE